jgi:hypothetical protein
MTSRVLILDLKDDPALIEGYEAHHRAGAVPEAIVSGIREAGIGRIFALSQQNGAGTP